VLALPGRRWRSARAWGTEGWSRRRRNASLAPSRRRGPHWGQGR